MTSPNPKRVYLSSTVADLAEHRERAYQAMRSLGIDVVSMEDQVAREDRPLDRCLADVASCDLYVGLFAFRYGHIPVAGNPDGRSITELEYRHAGQRGIPRLVLLVRDGEVWPTKHVDKITGEGADGALIQRLRSLLQQDHTAIWFNSPDTLAGAVSSSVARHFLERAEGFAVPRQPPVAPHPRTLHWDLLLLHAPTDADAASELVEALRPVQRVRAWSAGLTAATADELAALDHAVAASRSAAMLLTPASLTILAEDRMRSCRTLGLVRDRTGGLLGATMQEVPPGTAAEWDLSELVGSDPAQPGVEVASLASRIHAALVRRHPVARRSEVGLPVVVVALTAAEAADLLDDPPPELGSLLKVPGSEASWQDRYGTRRVDWRPFADPADTIEAVLATAVDAVNGDLNRLQGRAIRLQPYPLDPLMADSVRMWPVYEHVARTGCLVVVDELSLFHEGLRHAFQGSPLPSGEQVAFVTLAPADPTAGTPHAHIQRQLEGWLSKAARRFNERFDPLCELGIPSRRSLNRWLHGGLPRTIDFLREAPPDPTKLSEFAREFGAADPAMGQMVAGEGGPA